MPVRALRCEWSPAAPRAGQPVDVFCTVVNDDETMTVPIICVGVRDAFGHRYDFPGPKMLAMPSREAVSYKSGSRTFPMGEFRVFVAFRHPDGRWISLPSKAMFVSPS